jgi:hypothetical protein
MPSVILLDIVSKGVFLRPSSVVTATILLHRTLVIPRRIDSASRSCTNLLKSMSSRRWKQRWSDLGYAWIGFLNALFHGRSYIAAPAE